VIYKLHIDAFAVSPDVRQALQQVKEDRDLAKSRVNLLEGGLVRAVDHYADNPTPQVIIAEDNGNDQDLIEHLGHLAEVCEPGTKVIVLGQLNDISIYRYLMAQGVSEYLVTPVSAPEILNTIQAIFADPSAPPRGKLLAFVGARGGVGSSAVAQNVAWLLAESIGDDVIYIDFDIAFGTAGLAFNTDSKQTIAEALAAPDRVDPVLIERFLVRYGEHLKLLLSPADLRPEFPIEIEAVDKVLDITRQMAPFVVADIPHLWAGWTDHLMRVADDLVVVALPDLPNLRDAKSLVDQFVPKRGDALPTRLLLNRADAYRKTQLTAKDFQETLGIPALATLPFDPNLFGSASNNGQMLSETAKTHKVVESLRQIANQLSGRQPVAKKKSSGMMSWLMGDSKTKRRG
jgi:pilus assembly protein CpaE